MRHIYVLRCFVRLHQASSSRSQWVSGSVRPWAGQAAAPTRCHFGMALHRAPLRFYGNVFLDPFSKANPHSMLPFWGARKRAILGNRSTTLLGLFFSVDLASHHKPGPLLSVWTGREPLICLLVELHHYVPSQASLTWLWSSLHCMWSRVLSPHAVMSSCVSYSIPSFQRAFVCRARPCACAGAVVWVVVFVYGSGASVGGEGASLHPALRYASSCAGVCVGRCDMRSQSAAGVHPSRLVVCVRFRSRQQGPGRARLSWRRVCGQRGLRCGS